MSNTLKIRNASKLHQIFKGFYHTNIAVLIPTFEYSSVQIGVKNIIVRINIR